MLVPRRRADGPAAPVHVGPEGQKYVDFVEKERGLEFEHPVYVDFLTAKEFKEQVTADRDDLTDDDLEELEQATGLLRALGLVEGDVDLFDKINELQGKGIIGFYSYDDERLRIRGTELTPAVESTLVHELTHALQDQHFDLGKRFEELDEGRRHQQLRRRVRLRRARRGRRAPDRDGVARQPAPRPSAPRSTRSRPRQVKGFDAESKDIPEVLKTMLAAPYELGQALLAVAVQQGGKRAVDDLFRSPPTTEEQQLDPWTLVADHQGYLTVPEPELAGRREVVRRRLLRCVGWLLRARRAAAGRAGAHRGRRLGR